MKTRTAAGMPRSAGITLTEILISILILGVGLVSLATLFPIGLLRLRDAQRLTRSAYLFQSATADVSARGLFNANSFLYADLLNNGGALPYWYVSPTFGRFNPLTQDTASYPDTSGNPGASSTAYGLPFAYDPLWRYQTRYYLDSVNGTTPEARFASGIGFLPGNESDILPPSAYGLQRLTNFNLPTVMPSAISVPGIFVSPEDVVWQEAGNLNYTVAFSGAPGTTVNTPSTVVPDLSLSVDGAGFPTSTNDWRFSWMVTAQQTNGSNGAAYEGNIVIFENRPFSWEPATTTTPAYAAGETVYEGVFGYSNNVSVPSPPVYPAGYTAGYGVGADRTVLIRWSAALPDPVVKVGDWIADVTYERAQNTVTSRFLSFGPGGGVPNPLNNGEWDNLPAQRCFWYQVQKITPAQPDPGVSGDRSMVVYVNRKLDARTLLFPPASPGAPALPVFRNAVLVCPNVVNVIPQTFFVR